jgi:hypothetical protein
MAETPATPGNPFKEGAESSVDAQKIALTQLLADQGAKGAQVIQNRGQDAAALAAQQQAQFGQMGAGTNFLYQTFDRDAAQAGTNHTNEQARIQAANQAYMDQVKAAIPIHAKDTDAYYEALRKEFEDRQAEREQAMALARMAASRSGGGGGGGRSSASALSEIPVQQRTPSAAAEAGAAGGQRDILSAAAAVGMDVNAAKRRWVDKDQSNPFRDKDAALANAIELGIADLIGSDATWAEVMAQGKALAGELGLDYAANVQPWLAMYSPLWGVQDSEWIVPVAQGPSNAGRSSTARRATNVSPRASGKKSSGSSGKKSGWGLTTRGQR